MAQKGKLTVQERTMLLGMIKRGADEELGMEIEGSPKLYRHMLESGLVEAGIHHQTVRWEDGDVVTVESKKLRLRLTEKAKEALG
jgi:hypothetical protein